MARKVFVDVIVRENKDGRKRPMSLVFEDGKSGKSYVIDRLIQVKRCAAMKVGGTGIRYTVSISGKETYLFEDEGKWFVEAKQ